MIPVVEINDNVAVWQEVDKTNWMGEKIASWLSLS